jgi:D-glycero-alpha-D-manno-heptose-7-phosphate kinase
MIIRSRAPLRIGLAGGGTDVSPYSDLYGGAILNATINSFASASIVPRNDNKIILHAQDGNGKVELNSELELDINGELDLLKGVYNRIVKDFTKKPLSFELHTHVDAPPGSGLGSSSTLVVAIVGAFAEWLQLPLGEYDIAHLAFEIERIDLKMAGGKQDQYAATFGGFNFMEFYGGDKVIVNPLRVKQRFVYELETNLVLFHTATSRNSSTIIEQQTKNITSKEEKSLEATHQLKQQAVHMKEALLRGEIHRIGDILDQSWKFKKQMADGITNPMIDKIYEEMISAGATGGKISGAGGGGFMMFYCPNNAHYTVKKTLAKYEGSIKEFLFTEGGLQTWKI